MSRKIGRCYTCRSESYVRPAYESKSTPGRFQHEELDDCIFALRERLDAALLALGISPPGSSPSSHRENNSKATGTDPS